MPRPLIVRSPEERQRLYKRVAIATPLIIVPFIAMSPVEPMSAGALLQIVAPVGIAVALFLFIAHRGRKAEAQLVESMRACGFAPYHGEFSAGLDRWPASGFPLFEQSPWAVGLAFDDLGAGIRAFQGSDGSSESRQDLSGAAIHVPGGRLPAFGIAPARRGLLSSTPPSTAFFRADPAFSEDYSVTTGDPRLLERELGERVLRLWRTMPGWEMQGSGEWVIVSQAQALNASQVPAFADRLRTLSRVLREEFAPASGRVARSG